MCRTNTLAAYLCNIAGAGFDVVDPESLPADDRPWDLLGVILTPHVAIGGAPGWYERPTVILVANARRLRQAIR